MSNRKRTTADNGCQYHSPTCVTCPFKACVWEDMEQKERVIYLTRRGVSREVIAGIEEITPTRLASWTQGGHDAKPISA